MLVIWNHTITSHSAVDETDPTKLNKSDFSVLHHYSAFDLVEYNGAPEILKNIPHQITENQPIYVNGAQVFVPRGSFDIESHPRSLLRFAGPIVREWLKRLRDLNIKQHFFCPPYGLCVEFPNREALLQLRESLAVAVGCIAYTQHLCHRHHNLLPKQFLNKAAIGGDWLDLVFFTQLDKERIKAQLIDAGKTVLAESRYKLRVEYSDSASELRAMKGVKLVDQARPSLVASLELLDAVGVPPSLHWMQLDRLDGMGQIVAVADTGLDKGIADDSIHPDFRGRVNAIRSWPINESWNSYVQQPGADDGGVDKHSGHGTHVAGLVLGDGFASEGRYRGMAPKAQLVFQAIEQFTAINTLHQNEIASGYYLSGRPLDLRELFNEARSLGARIHVNAWGDPSQGAYTDDCYEADDFLHKNPDAVILFAAGNDGADKDGDRRIDQRSLYAPASAKNVIAIGATEGPRQGVGLRVNWNAFDQSRVKRFSNPRDREDAISGEPEHVALISSAGPTRDGRIKPDLCAPGTNLAAPRSQATDNRGWGLASPLPFYMYYGGTSMATGAAGGYFALLRQSWQAYLHDTPPSGMALKALAILAAQPVLRRDEDATEPRNIAGFGSINLLHALPSKDNPIRLIDFREPGLSTGEVKSYPFSLNKTQRFKAVLSWYDVPGEVLVNNLNLCLERAGQVLYWGNHEPGQSGQPDQHNNVEVIEVADLAPGHYVVRVIAANIPAAPQSFAVAFHSPLVQGCTIPIEWLHGIGTVYASRLKDKGYSTLNDVLSLSLPGLEELLEVQGVISQKIYTSLLLLAERLNWQLPANIPASITLAELHQPSYLGVSDLDWQTVTRALLPLTRVFDSSKHKRIQLQDLYSVQM